MEFEIFRKTFNQFIKKSAFTRLKKICLEVHLPQLINAVTFLEAAGILISQGQLTAFIELCCLAVKYGPDYLQRRHLQPDYYHHWLQKHDRENYVSPPRKTAQLNFTPRISIVITVNAADSVWLEPCLASILNQWYPHWELFLLGTGLALNQIQAMLKNAPFKKDSRIFSSNPPDPKKPDIKVLSTITGEFVVFPATGDLLSPAALFEVVQLLTQHPEADIVYADEDRIDAVGRRYTPFFKPDWSPDLALAMPYTGPLTFFRTSLVQAAGGIREELGPAAYYDLLLRVMDHTAPEKIHHIPKILYHRRIEPTDHESDTTPAPLPKQPLLDYLQRTSQAGQVLAGDYPGTYRIVRELPGTHGVSIIIPFKDELPLLSQCLTSIFQKTDYPLFEIILVNNQSQDKATYAYLDRLAGNPRVRRLDFPEPFNFSAMNNRAVELTAYPNILFLNNDTEVISARWLRAMLEHSQREEVGAVGAKLLYPDNTIQHGGLALGGGGLLCGDFFRGSPDDSSAHVLSRVIRNCSAVTGACLLTKKHLFQTVGGFDEVNLPICYNDVDYCLKLRARGYLIVWTPYARLYHHESASRRQTPRLAELERLYREQRYFEAKWWPEIKHDPYYNPNLSRIFDGYAY